MHRADAFASRRGAEGLGAEGVEADGEANVAIGGAELEAGVKADPAEPIIVGFGPGVEG